MSPDGVDWHAAYRYLEHELESVLSRVADRMEQLESDAGDAARPRVRSVSLRQQASGELVSVIAADGAHLSFSFVVYRDDVRVREQDNGASNTLVWLPAKGGAYRVEGTASSGLDPRSDCGSSPTVTVAVTRR